MREVVEPPLNNTTIEIGQDGQTTINEMRNETEDIEIIFENLSYTVKTKKKRKKKEKVILADLNGVFRSRELVAVMGASGMYKLLEFM